MKKLSIFFVFLLFYQPNLLAQDSLRNNKIDFLLSKPNSIMKVIDYSIGNKLLVYDKLFIRKFSNNESKLCILVINGLSINPNSSISTATNYILQKDIESIIENIKILKKESESESFNKNETIYNYYFVNNEVQVGYHTLNNKLVWNIRIFDYLKTGYHNFKDYNEMESTFIMIKNKMAEVMK